MRRGNFRFRKRTELLFQRAIADLGKTFVKEIQAQTSIEGITDYLLSRTLKPWFREYCQKQAIWMVSTVAKQGASSWREAAANWNNGHEIHRLLKAEMDGSHQFHGIIHHNAQVIQTLPQTMAQRITKLASEEAIAGRRGGEIVKAIHAESPHLAHWQAQRIARTEVAKTQAAITQTRALKLGVQYYTWQTTGDQRVRSSHAHMEGVICDFRNPPAPEALDGLPSQGNYGPGGIYNCRCAAFPLLSPEFESWPKKIVQGNNIVPIRLKDFEALQ